MGRMSEEALMLIRRFGSLVLLLPLTLGLAGPPAIAQTPPPPAVEPPADRKAPPFQWWTLAPLGLAAGYVYTGRWERAILVPLGMYVLVFVSAALAFVMSLKDFRFARPIGSLHRVLLSPWLGAGLAFGAGMGLVLLDQAFSPHAGAPWVAPALTAGTVLVIFAINGPDFAWKGTAAAAGKELGRLPDPAPIL